MHVDLCKFNCIMAASSNLVTHDSPKHETKREVLLTRFTSSPIFLSSPERSAAHEHMKPSAISLLKSIILKAEVAPPETSKATASCRCLDCENLRAHSNMFDANPVCFPVAKNSNQRNTQKSSTESGSCSGPNPTKYASCSGALTVATTSRSFLLASTMLFFGCSKEGMLVVIESHLLSDCITTHCTCAGETQLQMSEQYWLLCSFAKL